MVAVLAEPTVTERPNIYTDIPADLTPDEIGAYRRGYSRGCMTYIRKSGSPGIVGAVPASGPARVDFLARLTEQAIAHEIARQETAHRAAMASVRKWRKMYGAPVLVVAKPVRKPRTVKPAPVVETVAPAEPVTVPAPMPAMTWAARKATRRELAATLRAQGVKPAGQAWKDACRAAGLVGAS